MTRKAEQTRERILDAALSLMNESGVGTVTIAEIAAAVGISTGNLTYHYPTKRELLLALWERSEKRHLAVVRVWHPETVLADWVAWTRALSREMWTYRFFYRDSADVNALAPEIRERNQANLVTVGREQVLSSLQAMIDGGHMRPPEVELTVLARNAWVLLRYWISYLVESRGIAQIRRRHLDELLVQYAALIRPYLEPSAVAELEQELA